jgi:hypothetical protein
VGLLPEKILDAGPASLSRIERMEAFVDFRALGAKLFDMGQQSPPDLFLIFGRQRRTSAMAYSSVFNMPALYEVTGRKTPPP